MRVLFLLSNRPVLFLRRQFFLFFLLLICSFLFALKRLCSSYRSIILFFSLSIFFASLDKTHQKHNIHKKHKSSLPSIVSLRLIKRTIYYSETMSNNTPQHHHSKTSHNMLDKLSNKISAIKEDITEAVKHRSRSISSDRHSSIPSASSLTSMNSVTNSSQDDTLPITMQLKQSSRTNGKCQVQIKTYGSRTLRFLIKKKAALV